MLEIKWGLVPDMAGMVLMRGLVRDDVARELTYPAASSAVEEAVAMGLATRVCDDPRAEALAFAREIAAKNPHAIRGGKRLLQPDGRGRPARDPARGEPGAGRADRLSQPGRGGEGEPGEASPQFAD